MAERIWYRVGGRRTNIDELQECFNDLGVEIGRETLIRLKPIRQNIRHIVIGGKWYTKREWVAEWLDSLEVKPQERQCV